MSENDYVNNTKAIIARILFNDFDNVVDCLEELVKENPNDADLGLEVRKLVRELIEYRDKY